MSLIRPRVRFAPSPTGLLHIGGVRTAIYNWAFAKRYGGDFILRIDDTDPERSTVENTLAILSSMVWMGLEWDEGPAFSRTSGGGADFDLMDEAGLGNSGPYFQSQRSNIYQEALTQLIESGNAYPCFCSPEELAEKREAAQKSNTYNGYDRSCRNISREDAKQKIEADESHTWRLAVPSCGEDVIFDDAVFGESRFSLDVMDDLVLVRSDGTPTYNFTTVVDDWKMGITHVIRGDDHLSNTPRQVLIYQALGAPVPKFAHLPMILGADGKRLSKRHGATSVEAFADEGFIAEAMLNYLALLGWSLDGETTIISANELCANFDLSRISKNPAVFDPAKLEWMNSVYIRQLEADDFVEYLLPFLYDAGFEGFEEVSVFDDAKECPDWYRKIFPLINERIKKFNEAPPILAFIFKKGLPDYDEKSVEKVLRKDPEITATVISAFINALDDESMRWSLSEIESALRALPEELDLKPKVVFQIARVALCGSQVSPPLYESMELLGREITLERLRAIV